MPRNYAILVHASNGLWHARSEDFDDLTAEGEDPVALYCDLSDRIAERDPDPDLTCSLVVLGAGGEKDLEQVRLATLSPAIDPAAIRRLICKHGLDRHADRILAGLKPAVMIKTARAGPTRLLRRTRLRVGCSHFGGDPDLPRGMPWPTSHGRPLAMLAQMRLGELPAFPAPDAAAFGLPRHGFLWFWYDELAGDWSSDPDDPDGPFRITHVPDESTRLVRTPTPRDRGADLRPYLPGRVVFRRIVSVPWIEDSPEDLKRSFSLVQEVQGGSGRGAHYLRAHPRVCNDPTPDEVPDAELLLQLSSEDPHTGWGWGDAGSMHFWIRRDDLRHALFHKAWGAIDST